MYSAFVLAAALGCAPQEVHIEVVPRAPFFERQRTHLSLQCDFLISNHTAAPVALDELVMREFDAESNLIRRRFVDSDGTAPSIRTVVTGPIPVDGFIHVLNPFHHFEPGVVPARLEFDFALRSGATTWIETVSMEGKVYTTRTPLRLPIDGRLMVKDAHDFLSHHRRIGWEHPVVQSLGLEANASRYAYDLVVLGPDGAWARGTPMRPEDWNGWNAPVLAPGNGRVVRVVNDFPDSRMSGGRVVRQARVDINDVDTFFGNFVVIDHENGEFSMLGHLRMGSVVVAVGQRLEAGDPVGNIGLSGAVSYVHLHYHLQASPSLADSPGLPAEFVRYRLHRGSESLVVRRAPMDTGEIVEHVASED